MKLVLFFTFFLLLCVSVGAEWNTNSQEVNINMVIKGEADIQKLSSKARIVEVKVNLSLYPKEYPHQEIIAREMHPQPALKGDVALFTFNQPEGNIEYQINAVIKSINTIVPIKEHIPFPYTLSLESIGDFLVSTEIIDSDDEGVIRVASKIVEGVDDYYEAVFLIGSWVRNNVNYNLSTLTAETSQSASWVLLHRKGVCDELTSLFIAMLRSIGIPAKFITGYAYTNSPLFDDDWGAHGWAEVYFPNVGWVPFDVTYGQFGFVDPTHIKLKESHDANDAATRYEWLGVDVSLNIAELDTDITLLGYSGTAKPLFKLSMLSLKDEIQFGSYNAVEVVIENLWDSYLATELFLSTPLELSLTGERGQDVFLKPKQKKSVFWIFRLEKNLKENFLYTFPLSVRTSRNLTSTTQFLATSFNQLYGLKDIGLILDQKIEEIQKTYSSNVVVNCTPSKNSFYEYEETTIRCAIQNTGNVYVENLDVCYDESCKKVNVGISRTSYVNFPISTLSVGKRDDRITATNTQVSKAVYTTFDVLDKPQIGISEVEIPQSVNFEDEFTISFILGKQSYSIPEELDIEITPSPFGRTWSVKHLPQTQPFDIKMGGNELKEGINDLTILITYQDGQGNAYSTQENISVILRNVSLYQKLQIWYSSFIGYFLTEQGIMLGGVVIISLLIFAFIISFIFKEKT